MHCHRGGFTIDPWQAVETALMTHAHADHARPVASVYYAAQSCVPLLRHRQGAELGIRGVPFGEKRCFGDTPVSFNPTGHGLGSAQIRVQSGNEICVFTGDFKRDHDPGAEPFELIQRTTSITEATYAMPIYRWQAGSIVANSASLHREPVAKRDCNDSQSH